MATIEEILYTKDAVDALLADKANLSHPGLPLRGQGSPEGTVTAGAATEYVDVDGTRGAWLWVKKTASGSTGWGVVHGDTGWRNIASLAPAGITTEGQWPVFAIRRNGSHVQAIGRVKTDGVTTTLLAIPAGFRPSPPVAVTQLPGTLLVHTTDVTSGTPTYEGYVDSSGQQIRIPTFPAGRWLSWNWTWVTNDAWPAVLPGTPV